jgi:hypothetical protein
MKQIFFAPTLGFFWKHLTTWLHLGALQNMQENEVVIHYMEKITKFMYGIGIWHTWYYEEAKKKSQSFMQIKRI